MAIKHVRILPLGLPALAAVAIVGLLAAALTAGSGARPRNDGGTFRLKV